jgi:hypothetical protein
MTETDVASLEPGEVVIVDDAETLYRQVHPAFIDGGRPSSQAFKPTPKDEGKLSVRHSPMSPAEAFEAHVAAGYRTAGTWGVTVSEVRVAGLRAVDDSKTPDAPQAHAYIDFRGLGGSQVTRAAKLLAHSATLRGRLHPPPTGAP